MWTTKRNDEPATPAPAPRVEPTPPPPPPVRAAPPTPAPTPERAVIGQSMRIKGDIRSQEELYIDGEVEGRLESRNAVTVGPNGRVQADIKARAVTILGTVAGNVEVAERIAIREHGSLIGDIKTAGISIEDGAYFKGSIDIATGVKRADDRAKAAPAAELTQRSAGGG